MNGSILIKKALLRMLLYLFMALAGCSAIVAQVVAEPTAKPKLALGILIDTSAHQKNVIEFEREVLSSAYRQFGTLGSEVFVYSYSDRVTLLQDWISLGDGQDQVSPLIELDQEGGKGARTLLNDALNLAMLKLGTRRASMPRALIVIGEGNDSGSSVKFTQIKKQAKSEHIQCFALLVANHDLMGGRVRHYGFDLNALTGATQGGAYDVGASRKQLTKALASILKKVIDVRAIVTYMKTKARSSEQMSSG